jgi:hypothetical protein
LHILQWPPRVTNLRRATFTVGRGNLRHARRDRHRRTPFRPGRHGILHILPRRPWVANRCR